MSEGKASSGATPNPALRLSPRNRIVFVEAESGAETVAFCAKTKDARSESASANARNRGDIFLMRDESTSRKQDAPPTRVNDSIPDPRCPPLDQDLPGRLRHADGVAGRF